MDTQLITDSRNIEIATMIRDYTRDKSRAEGGEFDLPFQLFLRAFTENKWRYFFGLFVDDDGKFLRDSQEPEEGFMAKWVEEHWRTDCDQDWLDSMLGATECGCCGGPME